MTRRGFILYGITVAHLGALPKAIFAMDIKEIKYYPALRALAMIESGNNPKKKGLKGEVTEYQFLPLTYKSLKAMYPKWYTKHHLALEQLNWIGETFVKKTKRQPTDHEIYVMWNIGVARYVIDYGANYARLPLQIQDRGMRYYNLKTMYEANN